MNLEFLSVTSRIITIFILMQPSELPRREQHQEALIFRKTLIPSARMTAQTTYFLSHFE